MAVLLANQEAVPDMGERRAATLHREAAPSPLVCVQPRRLRLEHERVLHGLAGSSWAADRRSKGSDLTAPVVGTRPFTNRVWTA